MLFFVSGQTELFKMIDNKFKIGQEVIVVSGYHKEVIKTKIKSIVDNNNGTVIYMVHDVDKYYYSEEEIYTDEEDFKKRVTFRNILK